MNKEQLMEYTLRYPPTPITDEQIAAFEAKGHLRLPSDFRRFLKKWNGGDFACHDEFRIFDFTDPSNIGLDKMLSNGSLTMRISPTSTRIRSMSFGSATTAARGSSI